MKMQSNCSRDSSKKVCFKNCCALPPPQAPPPAAVPGHDFTGAILSTITPTTHFTNHESLPSSKELLLALTTAIPDYLNTVLADSIRAQHYHHLNQSNHVCLDYVGHGLFSYSQRLTAETASSSAAAQPPFFDFAYSSVRLASYLLYGGEGSEFEAFIKRRMLRYMNLEEDDYCVVFTANQSSAFKLVAESYPFKSRQNLVTVYDYENEAVEAMIGAARKGGGRPRSAVFTWPNLRLDLRKLRKIVVSKNKRKKRGLFVFPLQSRMTGSRYSYEWMNLASDNGWHVLLDASALAAKEMETLGLSLFQPDFLICSFFNVFGENPSGFCCLFVKKSSVSDLTQSSTAMGIINLVPANNKSRNSAIDEAELQTTPYPKEIAEIESIHLDNNGNDVVEFNFRGLDDADKLGLILISSRLRYLINWVVNALLSLRHPHSGDGLPLVRIYGPRVRRDRGPALAFNVYDWKGERVEPLLVQKLADRNNISLSLGILKNIRFEEDEEEKPLQHQQKKKMKEECGVEMVSASLGMMSNFEDVYRFWVFVSRFLDADFVEKERWRYTALNQTTVEV